MTDVHRFLRVFKGGNEVVIYDNGLDTEDFLDDPTVGTTEIGGGSIVVHQEEYKGMLVELT